MMFLHYIKALIYSLFHSRAYIVSELKGRIEKNDIVFTPYFSGRVAIKRIAENVIKRRPYSIVLVPRYICNVVPMALEDGGLRVVFYNTDEKFMPELENLLYLLDNNYVGLIVLCPLYGSNGGVSFLKNKRFRKKIRENNTIVLIDACQNMNLIFETLKDEHNLPERLIYVCSFNDKNTPGVMGGGILARCDLIQDDDPNDGESPSLMVLLFASRKITSFLLHKMKTSLKTKFQSHEEKKRYEFTIGKKFPYQLEYFKPTKLQLSLALIGIKMVPFYKKRQQLFLKSHHGKYMNLPLVITSSNIVWTDERPPKGKKVKQPYALHCKPEKSERPELLIITNNGFE